jgi:uncharacterized membrane protein HdeD (DUF308 family)
VIASYSVTPTASDEAEFRTKTREIINMASALESKSKSLTKNGVLLIVLGTMLCALGSMMARPMNEQVGYLLAEVLTALCLLLVCVSVGIRENTALPQRPDAVHLTAGAASIVCCLIFWLVQSASADLRLLGILAGLHGLVWGAWYLRLAFQFHSNSVKQLMLVATAATTSSLGIILATRPGLSKLGSVTAVGCYMIVLGMQLYLTSAFLYREYARAAIDSSN